MKRTMILSVVILGLALIACGDADSPGSQPTASPTSRTFTEPEWTITTPGGWTSRDVTSDADAKKAVRYESAAGEFVIVAIDPTGSDFVYDALWRYRPSGSSFEIVEKHECDGATDESCSDDDDRYDGYALWQQSNGEPPKVAGRTWYFVFGNANGTEIDAATFETVIESVQAKS